MHIEIVVEDASGKALVDSVVPKILGAHGDPHTWRIHPYKGVGRIPPGLAPRGDPEARILLDQLPRLLRGYSRTPGVDAVVVVLDNDTRDCVEFLRELSELASASGMASRTLFRLAIEETEAWYLGDRQALLAAYPRAIPSIISGYVQDSICGTWELLADAVYPGGSTAVKKAGWPLPGQLKHQWAEDIGPKMDVERNVSPSFVKLREGLRRITAQMAEP